MRDRLENPIHNKERRKGLRAIAASAVAAVAIGACTTADERGESSPTSTTEATTTTLSELEKEHQETLEKIRQNRQLKEEAEKYASSEERNQAIQGAVTEAGSRVIELAESGGVGYFDFYNPTTDTWGRGVDNEGYGWLRHNPQYGDTETQISVAVYQNADGSFDSSKIKGVSIHTPGMPAVQIKAPDYSETMLGTDASDFARSWEMIITPTRPDGELDIRASEHSSLIEASLADINETSAEHLSFIDQLTLDQLSEQMSLLN